MKGIVRRMDPVGRVVIPMEIRKVLDLNRGDPIEIAVQGNIITLEKYQESCVFCGSTKSISSFKKKMVCSSCKKKISQL